jgi:membrane-associated phospholipid phosphatase
MRARHVLLSSFLVAAVVSPFSVHAQDASPSRFLRWSYQDAAAALSGRMASDLLYVGGGFALVAGVSVLDPPIAHEVKEGYSSPVFANYVDVANEFGGRFVTIPVVTVFAASLATSSTRFQDAAFTSLQSLVYSGALNYTLKFAVGRIRPEDRDHQYKFRPFSGNSSFPSGHANAAFAILTPWAMYYPHPVTYVLVALAASGTALSRISRDKHWASDVVAGAIEGSLVAFFLSRRHIRLQRSDGDHAGSDNRSLKALTVIPGIRRGGGSLTVALHL